jgi:hypothetical protein
MIQQILFVNCRLHPGCAVTEASHISDNQWLLVFEHFPVNNPRHVKSSSSLLAVKLVEQDGLGVSQRFCHCSSQDEGVPLRCLWRRR